MYIYILTGRVQVNPDTNHQQVTHQPGGRLYIYIYVYIDIDRYR